MNITYFMDTVVRPILNQVNGVIDHNTQLPYYRIKHNGDSSQQT